MKTVLDNFTSVRRTRGGVLNPAQQRSILEMIRGILKSYDFATFGEKYQSFLNHLVDYNDPHKVTEGGFTDEIIAAVYNVYTLMTATPLSESDFRSQIVPTMKFIELIRRIILNRIVYDQVKNTDGSVPASATVYLNEEWGKTTAPGTSFAITFGTGISDESDFIRLGWNSGTQPVEIIFNADSLTLPDKAGVVLFHTSQASPHFGVNDDQSEYLFSLYGASNDLTIDCEIMGIPAEHTALVKLMNGTNTLSIYVSTDGAISASIDDTPLFQNVACADGLFSLTVNRAGQVGITALNNMSEVAASYLGNAVKVPTFVTGVISAPLANRFNFGFGIKSLTISK